MVLLIWSTLLFAASMMTFAWLGVDGTILDAAPDDTDKIELSRLHPSTAWATTGCLSFLTTLVLLSFLYFWRVCALRYSSQLILSFFFEIGVETFQLPEGSEK